MNIKQVKRGLRQSNYPGFQDGCLLLIRKRRKPRYKFVGIEYDKIYVYLGQGEILAYHPLGGVRKMSLEKLLKRHISVKTALLSDMDLLKAANIEQYVKSDILSAPLISRLFRHFYNNGEVLLKSVLKFCVLSFKPFTSLNWHTNEPFNYYKYIKKRNALTGLVYKRFV